MAGRSGAGAVGELWSFISSWFGLGDDEETERPAIRRGAAYMVIQTLTMIAFGTLLAVLKIAVLGGEQQAGWMGVLVPTALPMALAVSRRPPRVVPGLAGGLIVGALAAGAIMFLAGGALTGFWLGFLALATGAVVAGAVFGAVTGVQPAPGGPAAGGPAAESGSAAESAGAPVDADRQATPTGWPPPATPPGTAGAADQSQPVDRTP